MGSETRLCANLVIARDCDQQLRRTIIHNLTQRPTVIPRKFIGVTRRSGVTHMRKLRIRRRSFPFRFYGIADRRWYSIFVDEITTRKLDLLCLAAFDGLSVSPRTVDGMGGTSHWRGDSQAEFLFEINRYHVVKMI
jgi:hypothetical protein